MAAVSAKFSKGSNHLKDLETPIVGNDMNSLIKVLKEAKETANSFLTKVISEQTNTSVSNTRKARELVNSDDDMDESVKKQKR